jgi:hypothetical protein
MGHGWSEIAIKNIKKAAQKRCVPVSKFTLDGIWIEDFIGLSSCNKVIQIRYGKMHRSEFSKYAAIAGLKQFELIEHNEN